MHEVFCHARVWINWFGFALNVEPRRFVRICTLPPGSAPLISVWLESLSCFLCTLVFNASTHYVRPGGDIVAFGPQTVRAQALCTCALTSLMIAACFFSPHMLCKH